MAALEYLQRQTDEQIGQLYEKFKKELNIIYHTKGIMSSRQVVDMLASRAHKYGILNAFSATETLNIANAPLIKEMVRQMLKPESFIIILCGDFAVGSGYSSRLRLDDALSRRISQEYNLEEKKKKAGSIMLDTRDPSIPYSFHKQTLNTEEIKYIFDKAKELEIT